MPRAGACASAAARRSGSAGSRKVTSSIEPSRGSGARGSLRFWCRPAAFSTAGDYARAYVVDGRRYHHIIDPRTGYPAALARSVTVWAPDALTADAVDDAIFILGPERGLALARELGSIGVVIVDARNRVHVTPNLEGPLRLTRAPTDGP
jgi:thiamine biosynthesis lipoprotein ApbE